MDRVKQISDELFLKHPREVNESYVEHGIGALQMACWSGVGAMALTIHAIVPGLLPEYGSESLERALQIKKDKLAKGEKFD